MKALYRCMLVVLLGCPALAHAHAGLAVTVPEHDAVLDRAPALVHFQFMADMTITNVILEIGAGPRTGERIALRLPRNSIGQSTAFGESIDLTLPPLEPGTYVLTWQATSLDGHLMVDDLSFSIIPPA